MIAAYAPLVAPPAAPPPTPDPAAVVWDLVRLAQATVAHTAVIPLQDLRGLGSEARMNRPGQSGGNWQ